MPEGQPKVCVICKQDCSGRPHVKDKQGRYACRTCVEKKQAAAKAPGAKPVPAAASPPGGDPVMAKLVETSVAVQSTPCPQCSNPIPPDGVICTNCGFNTATGKAARTRVLAAEKEKKEKRSGSGPPQIKVDKDFIGPLVMLLLVGGLGVVSLTDNPEMRYAYLACSFTYGIIIYLLVVINAFKEQRLLWGMIGILSFCIPLIGLAMLWYIFVVNTNRSLKGHYAVVLLFGFLNYAVVAQIAGSGSA